MKKRFQALRLASSALLLVIPAATAFGGSAFTVTNCATDAGCSSSTTYHDFAPTLTLGGSLKTPIYGGVLPMGFEESDSQTLQVSFYTSGPARPGYLDLSYGGYADGSGYGGYYAGGSVMGLYSWRCLANGCNNHVFVPITIGGEIEIAISASSVFGRQFSNSFGSYYGGNGQVDFTVQVRDGSITDALIPMSSAPEPARQALGGMLLVAGVGFWRKRSRRLGRSLLA